MARKQGFIVYLDDDAKRRLADLSIRSGQTMNYIIRAAIEAYVKPVGRPALGEKIEEDTAHS